MDKRGLILGIVVAALLLCLIIIFWRRRLYREFPFFFSYLISVVLATIIEDAVFVNADLYFNVFWSFEAVHAVLALLALYEAFRKVFLVFYKTWRGFEVIFPVTLLVIVILATWNAASHPAKEAQEVIVVLLAIGKVIRYLQAAVFVLFFVLVWILGLDWEEYPFGIVLGFTISAVGAWLAYDVRSEFGTKFSSFWRYASAVAYFFAVLVWLAAFRRPREEPKQWLLDMTPEQMLDQAKQYLGVLRGNNQNAK